MKMINEIKFCKRGILNDCSQKKERKIVCIAFKKYGNGKGRLLIIDISKLSLEI